MKKVLIVLLLIVVLAGAGILAYVHWASQPVAMDKVVPSGALFYVDTRHAGANFAAFEKTVFWKKISSIDYFTALDQMGFPKPQVERLRLIYAQVKKVLEQDALKKFFGREFALAVYPTDVKKLSPDQLMKAGRHIYFITRLTPDTKTAAILSDVMAQFRLNQPAGGKVEKYKGFEIHLVPIQEGLFNIGYVRIHDLLVVGIGDTAARKCIDAYRSKTGNIANDPMYKMAETTFLPMADTTGYFNLKLFATDIQKKVLEMTAGDTKKQRALHARLADSFEQMQGYKSIGYSTTFQNGVSRVKMDLHYNKAALAPDLQPFYTCTVKPNNTLSLVPAGVLGYEWNGCYNIKLYWQRAKKEMEKAAAASGRAMTPEIVAAGIQKSTGLSLEKDVFPALGNEFAGYVADVDTSGPFPVPQIVVMLKIADQDKAQHIIDTLLAKNASLQPEMEEYDGAQIYFIPIPLLASLQPGYAFVNGYLLIATNSDSIKTALDVSKGNMPGLASSPAFQQDHFGLTGANDSVFFVQLDSVMSKLGDLVDWGNQWISMQEARQEAFKKGTQRRVKDIQARMEEEKSSLTSLQKQLKIVEGKLAKASADAAVQAPAPQKAVASPASGTAGASSNSASAKDQAAQAAASARAAQAAADEKAREIQNRDNMKKKMADIQKSLQTDQHSIDQMETLMTQLGRKRYPDAAKRQAMTKDFIKPLLGAFGSLKSFAARMVMKNNLIEVNYYLKME